MKSPKKFTGLPILILFATTLTAVAQDLNEQTDELDCRVMDD